MSWEAASLASEPKKMPPVTGNHAVADDVGIASKTREIMPVGYLDLAFGAIENGFAERRWES
jgi:hypothetical protein